MRYSRLLIAILIAAMSIVSIAPARAENFAIDPVHSAVIYRIMHMNMGHSWGRFNEISGVLNLDDANPASNSLSVSINSNSIDSGAAKRDEHLRGPDFFNAKQFPTITFQSEQMRPLDANNYEVTGTLTLHGVSRKVTTKVQRLGAGKTPIGDVRVGLETVLQLKRSDFDMKTMLEAVGDDVLLVISLEAAHK
jgi:polyisoprenoid-binding protein YceI